MLYGLLNNNFKDVIFNFFNFIVRQKFTNCTLMYKKIFDCYWLENTLFKYDY